MCSACLVSSKEIGSAENGVKSTPVQRKTSDGNTCLFSLVVRSTPQPRVLGPAVGVGTSTDWLHGYIRLIPSAHRYKRALPKIEIRSNGFFIQSPRDITHETHSKRCDPDWLKAFFAIDRTKQLF